jgi:hypothetical protein
MTRQTILATKGTETIRFRLNYRTCTARISSDRGARRMSLADATLELHALAEAGYVCR